MDQGPVKRPPPSAIPRLSRLPLPTAAAPKLVRPSPSRERLQADQGLNVSRLRRPSEDVFKKPHLPPPSSRKVSDNFYAQRRSSQYGHSIRTAASAESLASKRNSELCLTEIGPSLEERTIETLSQIPSSPSPSRRQSGFFRPSSPMRSPSRPTSEISQHPVPQITSPTKQFRPRASLSTDPSRPKPRAASSAPSSRKASENSRKEDPPVPLPKQDVVSPRMPPNGEKRNAVLRSSKSRQSLAQTYSETNGSAPAKDTPKSKQPKPRKPPSTLSSNITSPTSSVSKTSQRTSVTSESNCSEPPRKVPEAKKASKSSSALRESIAKAKAARKAARQSNANDAFADPFNSISMKDPFNQLQNETSDKALLKSRTRAARKSGHLNIAALGLKEIPHEVMTMYDYDPESTDDWYEAVDLVKFIAADNEFESLSEDAFPDVDVTSLQMDEGCKGNQFGGLEALDLHGNLLASLPIGLRRLQRLRSLNLAKNRLNMDAIEVITQIGNLTELRLGNNDLDGMFTPQLGSLQKLEVLDLRGNALTGLPDNLSDLTGLRVLNVAENQLTSLPFSALSKLPLVEINAQKNRLQGCLVPASIRRIEGLQILNVSGNSLEGLSAGDVLELPSLQQLFADANRIKALPNVSSWTSLLSLIIEDNDLCEIPEGLSELTNLKHADFKGNSITTLNDRIGLMENLMTFHIGNNPLRERKFLSMDTENLKRELCTRCAPEVQEGEDGEESDHTEFTLAPERPETSHGWRVKSGGVLDRSSTDLSRLEVEDLEPLVSSSDIRCLYLKHNRFDRLPLSAISFLSHSLTDIDLSHNPMNGEDLFTSPIALPHLQNLTLAATGLTSFEPLQSFLSAPSLMFLDVSNNRLRGALPTLRSTYPKLITFLASENQINSLSFEAVEGLQALDVSNNNIDFLPPRLGLLGVEESGGLRRLDVSGNSFRVPKWQIVAKGTEAVLDWLKNRLTPEELREWQGDTDNM
ncbi:uncharacterized protein CIMG_08621 [Coccidioides immitis RS]|uniref:Leucine-rich repeat-containing protein 40 n=1 Tax=Coccidioides immitis (strain RS) TaxID=246410 RepID=J3K5W1_COCIM|nr:uncharacterized protein CIMG_08621 [Coccidioides immitis RS]EAS29875.3 hypothetical protein CIMG_08621 [Coccidioides immitis RS]